jgi:hypothetical protein
MTVNGNRATMIYEDGNGKEWAFTERVSKYAQVL